MEANFTEEDLFKLGDAMTGVDGPKDGKDDEESDFGSAYTYFGQFIDHDLTFDPSSFQEQKSDPDGIEDFRTPRFDLDNLYGRGPATSLSSTMVLSSFKGTNSLSSSVIRMRATSRGHPRLSTARGG